MSCNFDYGLCPGWSQSTADVFNWTRGTGSTSSSDTGPSSEHTSESGLHNAFSIGISLHSFHELSSKAVFMINYIPSFSSSIYGPNLWYGLSERGWSDVDYLPPHKQR